MRVTKRKPNLDLDEVAFPLFVEIPRMWGRIQTIHIDVALPDPPASRVTVGDPEMEDA